MKRQRVLLLISVSMLMGSMVNAQSAVVSAGGNASGSNGSVSYSIGQTVANFSSNESGSVLAGVQQPYVVQSLPPTDCMAELQVDFSVFPNPTTDMISLSTSSSEQFSFELLSNSGASVQNGMFSSSHELSMTDCVPSTYFLRISDAKGCVKVFKIVKN